MGVAMRALLVLVCTACVACGGRVAPEPPVEAPVDVPPSNPHGIVQMTSDGLATCVVRVDGGVWCWGSNRFDRLGLASVCGVACSVPTELTAFRDVAYFAHGAGSQCAALRDGRVACHGRCRFLGHDAIEATPGQCRDPSSKALSFVVEGLSRVVQIELGPYEHCVRFADGSVRCANDSSSRTYAPALPGKAVAISVGEWHACAIVEGGDLYCWGQNADGEVGSDVTETGIPLRVEGLGPVDEVRAGVYITCAHERDGHVSCFGIDNWDTLGFPGSTACGGCDEARCRRRPARVEGVLAASQLDTWGTTITFGAVCGFRAQNRVCTIGNDGSPWCWGRPFAGDAILVPHRADLTDARLIATGGGHACVVKYDGNVWCWGANEEGELGDGTLAPRLSPVRVALPWDPSS